MDEPDRNSGTALMTGGYELTPTTVVACCAHGEISKDELQGGRVSDRQSDQPRERRALYRIIIGVGWICSNMTYAECSGREGILSLTWRLPNEPLSMHETEGEVPVDIEVEVTDEEWLPVAVSIDTAAGLIGDRTTTLKSTEPLEYEACLIGHPDTEHEITVRVAADDERRVETALPPLFLFAAAERITTVGLDEETMDRINRAITAEGRLQTLIQFQSALRPSLSEQRYYDLVGALVEADDAFADWWTKRRIAHFRDRVFGRGEPNSLEAVQELLRLYNELLC